MRAMATRRPHRDYHKGFAHGVAYGVIIATFMFLGALTLAAMYSPNGF